MVILQIIIFKKFNKLTPVPSQAGITVVEPAVSSINTNKIIFSYFFLFLAALWYYYFLKNIFSKS